MLSGSGWVTSAVLCPCFLSLSVCVQAVEVANQVVPDADTVYLCFDDGVNKYAIAVYTAVAGVFYVKRVVCFWQ